MDLLPPAVLWDMDGTIVDTQEYWYRAENGFLQEHGTSLTPEIAEEIIGTDLKYGATLLKEHAQSDWPTQRVMDYIMESMVSQLQVSGVPFQPGAWELLKEFHSRGVPQALVTMSWKQITDPILATFEFNPFSYVVTGDSVPRGKPHPDPYLKGAQMLGVPIEQCVAVEDSPTGVRSAVASGAQVFVLQGDAPVPQEWGHRHISSLLDVTTADFAAMSVR